MEDNQPIKNEMSPATSRILQEYGSLQRYFQSLVGNMHTEIDKNLIELEKFGFDISNIRKEISEISLGNIPSLERNDISFELGPELDELFGNSAKSLSQLPSVYQKIEELNKKLSPEEKPWRLPTRKDWFEILSPYSIAETLGEPEEKLSKIKQDIRSKYDLKPLVYAAFSPDQKNILLGGFNFGDKTSTEISQNINQVVRLVR